MRTLFRSAMRSLVRRMPTVAKIKSRRKQGGDTTRSFRLCTRHTLRSLFSPARTPKQVANSDWDTFMWLQVWSYDEMFHMTEPIAQEALSLHL